jgi:hypothetical protein
LVAVERKYLANVPSTRSFLSLEIGKAATEGFTAQNRKSLIQDRVRRRERGTFWMKMMMMKMMLESDFCR